MTSRSWVRFQRILLSLNLNIDINDFFMWAKPTKWRKISLAVGLGLKLTYGDTQSHTRRTSDCGSLSQFKVAWLVWFIISLWQPQSGLGIIQCANNIWPGFNSSSNALRKSLKEMLGNDSLKFLVYLWSPSITKWLRNARCDTFILHTTGLAVFKTLLISAFKTVIF